MKVKLNEHIIRRIKPGRQYDIRDAKQPGLMVRVYSSGAASFMVSFGRNQLMTLAPVAKLTVEQARENAKIELGKDEQAKATGAARPLAERRKKKAGSLRAFLAGPYREWASTKHRDADASIDRIERAFPDLLDKRLDEITAFGIEKWRAARRKGGVGPATCNKEISLLRGALSRAIEWNALASPHPLKAVKDARLDKFARIRFLSPEEEAHLLAALEAREQAHRTGRASFNQWRVERGYAPIPDFPTDGFVDHLQPVVRLAMHTGARRGELLGLHWRDIDFVSRMVTFCGTTTKTGLSRRVPLNATAFDVLTRWKPQNADADALVFPGPKGERMFSLKTAWGQLMKDAKIRGFRFHDLRHHAASRLVQAGTDLYVVSQILGHRSVTMTQRYAHLRDSDKAAALEKLA